MFVHVGSGVDCVVLCCVVRLLCICILLISSFCSDYGVGCDVVEAEECYGGWCVDPVSFRGL